MRQRGAEARRRTQRSVGERQQPRRRPCLAGLERKAQPHVLVLALLDEDVVPIGVRQRLLEERLKLFFGHRKSISQSAHTLSSRAWRGTFPVALKVPCYARDD